MLLIDQTQTQANGSASGAGAARADKLPSPIVTSL